MVTFSVRNRKIRLPKGTTIEEAISMTEFFEKNPNFLEIIKKATPKQLEEMRIERWLKEAFKALGHIS